MNTPLLFFLLVGCKRVVATGFLLLTLKFPPTMNLRGMVVNVNEGLEWERRMMNKISKDRPLLNSARVCTDCDVRFCSSVT